MIMGKVITIMKRIVSRIFCLADIFVVLVINLVSNVTPFSSKLWEAGIVDVSEIEYT